MKLTEIIHPDSIITPLNSNDRDEVIGELIDVLIKAGAAPASIRKDLIERVLDRERKHSTGFGEALQSLMSNIRISKRSPWRSGSATRGSISTRSTSSLSIQSFCS